jgi:hypothetical protein
MSFGDSSRLLLMRMCPSVVVMRYDAKSREPT